jgi:hypothetical protein
LAGTETVPIVQGGATVRTTTADIANEATALGAFTSGAHTPTTDDGAALGSTGNKWSDLWLASGGVINWNSGNYTITHSAGVLAFSGAATIGTTLGVTGLTTLTGGLKGGVQTLSGAGAIDITTVITKLSTTGANALTLADGAEGQIKLITCIAYVGDGTLTPSNLGAATTITFNSAGDSVLLQFLGTDWWVVANNGCAVA